MKRVVSMFLVLLLIMSSTVAFAKNNKKSTHKTYTEDYSSEIGELEDLLKRYHENENERKWLIKMLTEFRNLSDSYDEEDEEDSEDEEDDGDYIVYLNGEEFDYSESAAITYKDMSLPTDLIREGLGAKISYAKKTSTLSISRGDTRIVIKFKNKKVLVNNVEIKKNILSKSSTSTTLQLIKFIAQTLGHKVELDEDEGVITIEGNGNLAGKKAASADSAQGGYPASMGNDEDGSTRWCAANSGVNHWWQVDLGSNYDLSGSEIKWEFNKKNYKYKIEVSSDNVNWSLAVNKTGTISKIQTQRDNFKSYSTRYIRVTVTGLESGCWASICEFKAFGNTHVNDSLAPIIPERLNAYTVSTSQINLSWAESSDNYNVAGYKVFRNGTQIATVTNRTTYSDTGLSAGTSYSYAISAFDAAGNSSSLCTAVYATTLTTADSGNGLKGEYYDNIDFTNLKLTRVDPRVEYTWGTATPDISMDKDTFSVRWTGQILPQYSQEYSFRTISDDGVCLWVNGVKIIDNWNNHSETENFGKIQLVAGQKVDIRMDYYDNTGDAVAKLYWESASVSRQIIPQSQLFSNASDTQAPSVPAGLTAAAASASQINVGWNAATDNFGVAGYKVFRNGSQIASITNGTSYADTELSAGTSYAYSVVAYDAAGNFSAYSSTVYASTSDTVGNGNGLAGVYYNNAHFTDLRLSRIDARINFDWGSGTPTSSIDKGTFAVRWTGQLMPLHSEEYTFCTKSDDGVRLWVGGVKVIDNWTAHSETENSGKINLTAGQKVDIKLEYYQDTGDAVIKLLWASHSQKKQIIPQSQLYANLIDTQGPSIPEGLTALAVSSTQINLRWSASEDSLGVAGYKVYRNGTQIANVTSGRTYADTGLTQGNTYTYSVAAYDAAGNQSALCSGVSAVTASVTGNGNGLRGEYFEGKDFNSLKLTRTDAKIDFNWYTESPSSVMGNDNYSVRWTGQVLPLYSEEYTFQTRSDDGIRLWINGTKIIDNWTDHSATDNEGKIRLTAGQKVDIKLEYFEGTGDAVARLYWQSPSQAKQIVPQSQLFTSLTDTQAPSVPTGLTITPISANQLNLVWTASVDAFGVAGYKIYRNGTQVSLVVNDTRFSDTGLTAGTTYSYTISAYDAAGNTSAVCAAVSGTSNPVSPIQVNDNTLGSGSNQFNYSDNWSYGSQSGAYMNDNHWSRTTDAYYTVLFTGTQIKLFGAKDVSHGIAEVYIDGVLQGNIDLYAATRSDNVLLFTSATLAKGQHTLKVKVTGTKNSNATNDYIPADRVEIIDV